MELSLELDRISGGHGVFRNPHKDLGSRHAGGTEVFALVQFGQRWQVVLAQRCVDLRDGSLQLR